MLCWFVVLFVYCVLQCLILFVCSRASASLVTVIMAPTSSFALAARKRSNTCVLATVYHPLK